MFPNAVDPRVIDFGRTVRFDTLMLNSLSICDLSSAFRVSIAAQVRVAFTNASESLRFPFGAFAIF